MMAKSMCPHYCELCGLGLGQDCPNAVHEAVKSCLTEYEKMLLEDNARLRSERNALKKELDRRDRVDKNIEKLFQQRMKEVAKRPLG